MGIGGGHGHGPGGSGRFDDDVVNARVDPKKFKRILPYLLTYKYYFLAGLFFMLIVTMAGLITPIIEARAIDIFIAGSDTLSAAERQAGLGRLAAIYFSLFLVTWLCSYWQTYFISWAGQNLVYTIRQKMYEHLQNLSFDFFDGIEVGRVMSRVTNDVNALSELVSSGILNVFNDSLMLGGTIFILLRLNWRLALLTFATFPFLLLIATRFRGRMHRAYYEVRRKVATVNANLQESISGMRVTQSFAREDRNASVFNETNSDNMQANMQAAQLNAAFGPLVEVVATLGVCAVVWYGGFQIRQGVMTVGAVFAFLRYVARFFMPIRDLSQVYSVWQAATVSIDRIFELLDTPPSVQDVTDAVELQEIQGEVRFEGVTFAYKEGIPVLHNVHLHVPVGQTLALVGQTGAGKSTIINLLCRFYDPSQGRITIDGQDLCGVSQRSLHRQLGIVLQDTFLFSGTVRDNIRYGRPEATDEEVVASAKAVNAHDFIMRLPEGYDTEVQERGGRLSVGQKQLVSFARAILCDPRIIILDEATSSVDAYTELLIQQALEVLLKDRTAFVIAHRLSTVRRADRIIAMDEGKIVEDGTHEDLLQLEKGVYRNLYEMQFRNQAGNGTA